MATGISVRPVTRARWGDMEELFERLQVHWRLRVASASGGG